MEVTSQANSNNLLPTDASLLAIEKIISKACTKHPRESCEFLHLSSNASNPRICMVCIAEQDIPMKNTLSIRQLLKASKDSFLTNYPVLLEGQLINQTIKSYVNSIDSMISQIDGFFDQLSISLNECITKAKQTSKTNLIELAGLFNQTQDKIQEVSKIEELQQIIIENNNNTDSKLAEFLKSHFENAQQNTTAVNENYANFQRQFLNFSFEQPNEIKTRVCEQLKELNIFAGVHSRNIPLSSIQQKPKLQSQSQVNQLILPNYAPSLNFNPFRKSTILQSQDISCLSSISFSPSQQYCQSAQFLQTQRYQNGQILITNTQPEFECVQGYFDQSLNPTISYTFRLVFQSNNRSLPQFCVGLIPERKKDIEYIGYSGMSYHELYEYGLDKVVRGNKLNKLKNSTKFTEKRIEIKILLAERLLTITDYPNRFNVAELDNPMKINADERYYLGIYFAHEGNSVRVENVLQCSVNQQ